MKKDLKLKILDLMITARCMEERMIQIFKGQYGHFWLGGIGEEAFNVALGLLAKRRPDDSPDENMLDYDFFHFHYRNGATMLAMGMDPADEISQMLSLKTDPFSGGRNFCNHYARQGWNVTPTTSTIQTQCSIAPGTAIAQKRHGGDGLTIVTFGDAGTAEGDFHVGLNWATAPLRPTVPKGGSQKDGGVPLLFICTNNSYGISTPFREVHGQNHILDLAKGFGIPGETINGNDVEESYQCIEKAMAYVRKHRKPYFIEATVSRLNGHSSSSGAYRVDAEPDPLHLFRDQLIAKRLITVEDYENKFKAAEQKMQEIAADFISRFEELSPAGNSIYDFRFKSDLERERFPERFA